MIIALMTLVGLLGQPAEETPVMATIRAAARSLSVSVTGRLALEMNGDLWVSESAADGRPVLAADTLSRVTTGPAWDRDPVWTTDGSALVFASDRAGQVDLWRVAMDEDGAVGAPERLTTSAEPDTEPTTAADGTVAFVRGRGTETDLWVRTPDGAERRLTTRDGAERSPTFAPDGLTLAYVAGRQLRRLSIEPPARLAETSDDGPAGGSAGDRVIVGDLRVVDAAWSPRGDLIAFTASAPDTGVFVTPPDGRYSNLVSHHRASAAWSADADQLLLTELPRPAPGYNGDPDRLKDRTVGDTLPLPRGEGRLWVVSAPAPVGAGAREVSLAVPADRTAYNAEAFDRVWQRVGRLYFGDGDRRVAWEAIGARHRPAALAATSDDELQDVVHSLVRERPTILDEVSGRAVVSSAHPAATAAGLQILEQGGNVVDAAVAVSFALGVVEPDASGVGGYGQMLVYLTGMDEPVTVEFLSRAPEAATLDNAAVERSGGAALANVPGTVRGMDLAWRRHGSGRVAWDALVEPAIRLAEEGFTLDDALPTTLTRQRRRFLESEGSRALFFEDGEPLSPGETLRNPGLAWTLGEIADGGADAFYEGEIADRLVADLRAHGSAITAADMRRYFAVERAPVRGVYRGHTVYSGPPPVSGGAALVAKLHLLEHAGPQGLYTDDADTLHALIEAWKLQPSTWGRIADPSLWPVDLEPLIDLEAAGRRWRACFDPDESTRPADLQEDRDLEPACAREVEQVASAWGADLGDCGPTEVDCVGTGTTAFTVADADGNMVVVTQTLGTWGGTFHVTPGLGFLYNDKLRSYGSNPSRFGARLPYARNTTSIAPTLVFTGTGIERQPYLAVAAAGNAWITAAVYEVISGVIDGGLGPQRALELPRFLVGVRRVPGESRRIQEVVVQAEDLIAPDVLRRLRERGHVFQLISLRGELRMGYGAAAMVDDGVVVAGADPRRSGAAGAIK